MSYERKTDRVYGSVATAIRNVAKRGKPFTIADAKLHTQHRRMLSLLVSKGELRRLKQGGGKTMSVYIGTECYA